MKRKEFVIVVIVLLIVYSTAAYLVWAPRPRERFVQVFVLAEDRMATGYFSSENRTMLEGEGAEWFLRTINRMGSTQMIILKVKVANSTLPPPDEKRGEPSRAPEITEYSNVVLDGETWEVPLRWRVLESARSPEGKTLTIQAEDSPLGPVTVSSDPGGRFRVLVEVWTLDPESGGELFGWRVDGERKVAWLQVWFD